LELGQVGLEGLRKESSQEYITGLQNFYVNLKQLFIEFEKE